MIAAAARRSGTNEPLASVLYRGSTVCAISRDIATARARASVTLRDCARCAEYRVVAAAGAGFGAGRRDELVRVVSDFAVRVFGVAPAGATIPTRLAIARVLIQKFDFLFTWLFRWGMCCRVT